MTFIGMLLTFEPHRLTMPPDWNYYSYLSASFVLSIPIGLQVLPVDHHGYQCQCSHRGLTVLSQGLRCGTSTSVSCTEGEWLVSSLGCYSSRHDRFDVESSTWFLGPSETIRVQCNAYWYGARLQTWWPCMYSYHVTLLLGLTEDKGFPGVLCSLGTLS
jgi:hypothetical protein